MLSKYRHGSRHACASCMSIDLRVKGPEDEWPVDHNYLLLASKQLRRRRDMHTFSAAVIARLCLAVPSHGIRASCALSCRRRKLGIKGMSCRIILVHFQHMSVLFVNELSIFQRP